MYNTLEFNEQILLANLNRCNDYIDLIKTKFNSNISEPNKLFENFTNNYWSNLYNKKLLSEIYQNNSDAIISVNNNNYINYFKKFDNYLSNELNNNVITSLYESTDGSFNIDELLINIRGIIDKLMLIDDLTNFRFLNPIVQQTKLFSKQPIYVYGFNIFDISKIANNKWIIENKIFSLLFDNYNKQLIFVPLKNTPNKQITIYNIENDYFGDYNTFISKYNVEQSLINYQKLFGTKNTQNNNIQIITNNELTENTGISYLTLINFPQNMEIKFTDNLFNHKKRLSEFKAKHSIYYNSQKNNFIK